MNKSPIALAGDVAMACLQHGTGQVLARFPSSVYLLADNGAMACLLPAGSEPGPLHALLAGQWPDSLLLPEPGMRWWQRPEGIIVGRLICDLTGVTRWQVPVPSTRPPRGAAFHASAPPETFLAVLLGDVQRLGHADWRQPALAVVTRLMHWIEGHERLPSLERLVGLGPGLTPAADDFLGALTLTLAVRGENRLAGALVEALTPLLDRTHPVSAAHLSCALQGHACEALHLVVNTVAAGRMPDAAALERLTRLGGQSGWDMLAGVLVGARLLGEPPAEAPIDAADPVPGQSSANGDPDG